MNIFRLGAAMLADAICTVVTGGIYLATRNGYDSTSFTQDEFMHQRQLDNFKASADFVKKDDVGSQS